VREAAPESGGEVAAAAAVVVVVVGFASGDAVVAETHGG